MTVMTSTELGVMPSGRVNAVAGGRMIGIAGCGDEDDIMLAARDMGLDSVDVVRGDTPSEEAGEWSVGIDDTVEDAEEIESGEGSGAVEVISHTEACSLPFP